MGRKGVVPHVSELPRDEHGVHARCALDVLVLVPLPYSTCYGRRTEFEGNHPESLGIMVMSVLPCSYASSDTRIHNPYMASHASLALGLKQTLFSIFIATAQQVGLLGTESPVRVGETVTVQSKLQPLITGLVMANVQSSWLPCVHGRPTETAGWKCQVAIPRYK